MTIAEHEFMGQLLGGLLGVFFLVVLPLGLFLKSKRSAFSNATLDSKNPADDPVWETPIDGLTTSQTVDEETVAPEKSLSKIPAPSKLDLLGVGFYVLLFLGIWKMSHTSDAGGEFTVGVVLANAISFLILASLIPVALFWRTNLKEFFGLAWKKWPLIFAIAPAFVVGMLILAGLVMYFSGYATWVDTRFGAKPQEVVQLLKDSWDPALLASLALSAVVVAPIAEEIIFRGYIFRVTREYTGFWAGALFSGILFGVIHFNVLGLPVLAIFGVMLAFIYEKTKSIWAPIACHAAFNGFQVAMAFALKFGHLEIPKT